MSNRQAQAATTSEMASRQREISVSEFFLKNRHLLGFDTPAKALVTAVKEAVDNALDACEEAGVLPEITVEVRGRFERSRIAVEDNGPGIVESQIARIFGKLLYGSKFHKLSQSRGQQGMGISAAGMYGQLTVAKPLHIISRTEGEALASELYVSIDTANKRPDIHKRQPAGDVFGIAPLPRYSEVSAQKGCAQLGNEFLGRICLGAEAIPTASRTSASSQFAWGRTHSRATRA